MMLQKTVKAKIFSLTRIKEALLRQEYDNFQANLKGFNAPLYSATKQQAQRLLRRLNGKPKQREYPMTLRRDVYNIRETKNKHARFWAKIPVHGVWGGIKVPIQVADIHENLLRTCSLREGKLIWKGDHWSLHMTVMKEVEDAPQPPSTILAVDLGEKHIATSVEIVNGSMRNPRFHGDEVRGIRRHYAWLRRRLGERKLLKTIRKIGEKEKRRVNSVLHKISKDIVGEAKKTDAVIVLGDLRGIRGRSRGRRMNRIVANMPYYKLTQMITYKAHWTGVPVVKVNEAYTSKTCHRCGERGKRPHQGLFICTSCGLEYNADLNGAINIAKRFSEQCLGNGAVLDTALNYGEVKPC